MGRRRNNPDDMTITEKIEKIKEMCCDDICRYCADANAKAAAIHVRDDDMRADMISVIQAELHKHCEECPIKRL